MPNVSGLAASIRAATESETFDLAGQNATTITSNIQDGFEEPFSLEKMIRITFITGAGKLGRQKYDDGAAKAVTSVLRNLGFEDDRGASAVMECAGSFKMQHDTGKNLKTVVVFPKVINIGETQNNDGGADGGDNNDGEEVFFPKSSPEHMVALSSMIIFERMLASKCVTWSQKKGCANAIGTIKDKLESLDEKLLSGTPLTDSEQTFYDSVSMSSLEEKQSHTKEQMHGHIDSGSITLGEKRMLVQQVGEKLQILLEQIEQAEKDGKKKRVENLTKQKQKAVGRKEKLEKIGGKPLPKLKHEAEINKLRKEMEPLLEIEEAARGRLLSIKETQAVGKKDEIQEQVKQLEISSRGWFEEDEEFMARIEASRSIWVANNKKKKSTKSAAKSSGYKVATSTSWATPTSRKKPTGRGAATKKKSSNNRGGGIFGAMMMASDSD